MGKTINPVLVTVTTPENAPTLSDETYAEYRSKLHSLTTTTHDVNGLRVSMLEGYRSGRTDWSELESDFARLWSHWKEHSLGGVYVLGNDSDTVVLDSTTNTTELLLTVFARSEYDTALEDGGLVGTEGHFNLHAVQVHETEEERNRTFASASPKVVDHGEWQEESPDTTELLFVVGARPGEDFEPVTFPTLTTTP